MIKHIVMWKLRDEAHGNSKQQNANLIKEKLELLKGKIEGLIEIEAGVDIKILGNYDVVLIALFKDVAALDSYQAHPLHQAIIPFIKEAAIERHAVDYSI